MTPRQKMQPRAALRALKALINNPEDTRQVFLVIRALSGDAVQRGYHRFKRTLDGPQILERPQELIDVLKDREALRALPAGSLGRAYLEFVTAEGLSADGLVEASENDTDLGDDQDLNRYAARLRDQHDLWHTLTGYGRDELGEMCLLAFTYAQTRNRGLGVITLAGAYKLRQSIGKGVFRAGWRAFQAGRRARWLPAQTWEVLLERPMDDVRSHLRVEPPVAYQALRSSYAAA